MTNKAIFQCFLCFAFLGAPIYTLDANQSKVIKAALTEKVENEFWALYQSALQQQTSQVDKKTYRESFYNAHLHSPSRAEPLYHLAQDYRLNKEYKQGLLFAEKALSTPLPKNTEPVENWIYDWGIEMEYSLCAYYSGDKEKAIETWLKMLERRNLPKHVQTHVENNLKIENVSFQKEEELPPAANVSIPEFERSLNEKYQKGSSPHPSKKNTSWLEKIKSFIPNTTDWSGRL